MYIHDFTGPTLTSDGRISLWLKELKSWSTPWPVTIAVSTLCPALRDPEWLSMETIQIVTPTRPLGSTAPLAGILTIPIE